jgi:TRAP-type mannitol/chloroaromatic compound transport system substrate-binding protein
MNRRSFVRGAGAAAAAAAAAAATAACRGGEGGQAVQTGRRVRWRMASSFPKSLDTIYGAAEVLAERVEQLSGGNFQIRVHPAGEIVPALQVLDAVQEGAVQAGHTAGYYYTGKNPALAFDTCLPFGLTSRQQTAWLTQGGGLELTRQVYSDFGVINFPGGNTGAQMGGWFTRQVNSVGDLQGLRMRIPGLGGEVMSKLGVNVQVLGGGDIYIALERGAIDATEWVGPYDDEKLGFHKIAKNYYYPGWWEPGPNLSVIVNRRQWDRLPATYQHIFEVACAESAVTMQARYDHRNAAALGRLLDGGVQLRRFSDDLMDAASKVTEELTAQLASGDPLYRKIFESWSAARQAAHRWFGTAEAAYAAYAFKDR